MKLILLLSCLSLLLATVARANDEYSQLTRHVVDELTLPSINKFAEALPGLASATEAYCADSTLSRHLEYVREFHSVMDAWQAAQIYTFGPVVRKGRYSRIHFWPGRSGATARYLRKTLKKKPMELTDAIEIGKKSVAIHSLVAYESFMFGKSEVDPYICRVGVAIARFQTSMIETILDEWEGTHGFRQEILSPLPDGIVYRSSKDSANDIMAAFFGGLENITRLKLRRPLGKSIESAKPRRFENWRSGRSKRNIDINLRALETLYNSTFGLGALLRRRGGAVIDDQIRNKLTRAIDRLKTIPGPLHVTIEDPQVWNELDRLHRGIVKLQKIISGEAAPKLGLVIGFNSLDGD